ncbi:MAG TPA: HIT family protein [Ignavibacteriaceae bacterium]|nr:HIT family protein [Ignavibacteriaceae bacterium]
MECIFCNIIAKKSEAEFVFEDDNVIAFLDIAPVNYGHTLVIPKRHYDNFLTVPVEELDHLMKATQFISGAVKRSMNADGFNVISNNGDSAGQSVYHFHFHIIPRFKSDFNLKPNLKSYSSGIMQEYAEKIRSFVSKYRNLYNG